MSITKASAIAFVMGAAFLMSAPDARAGGMSAADKYQAAQAQCATLVSGQQAFCMEEAYTQYQVNAAKEGNKEVTIHHDYDTSNDTPAQTKAKAVYQEAVSQCATEVSGQQAFCMEEAHDTYEQSMGWK